MLPNLCLFKHSRMESQHINFLAAYVYKICEFVYMTFNVSNCIPLEISIFEEAVHMHLVSFLKSSSTSLVCTLASTLCSILCLL